MNPEIAQLTELVRQESQFVGKVQEEVAKVIVGQKVMVERILMGLLTGGHVLLEGLPGLAKTLTVKTIADTISVDFKRVQFTPDLLPSDLTGTMIYNQKTGEFTVKKGPVFTNILLADEINRAPAKVQAALLECMGERQVTIGEVTHKLTEPFLVLATQNPIEQEGTYPLPEAQMDRFMFKVVVAYPNRFEEMKVLERQSGNDKTSATAVTSGAQILKARAISQAIFMDQKVKDYILDIVFATREPKARKELKEVEGLIQIGASPRATIALAKSAKARAFMEGRAFVTPDDVKAVALDVLRHRITLSFEAEAEDVTTPILIKRVLSAVPAP
jgi:MoxR-like ATPase